jgi:uncharacterized protein YecT (DUF1311 family)
MTQNEQEICRDSGSMADMGNCLANEAKESETALKEAEERLRDKINKWFQDESYIRAARTKLVASGKAFIRYREAQCAFSHALGGSAIGHALDMRRNACIASQNNQRAALLLTYANEVLSQEEMDEASKQDCMRMQEQNPDLLEVIRKGETVTCPR